MMGFKKKWLGWMKWHIFIARFSVLVNGTPSCFFQRSKGLSLGDLLSPYLFVIVIEALSCLLKGVVPKGSCGWGFFVDLSGER